MKFIQLLFQTEMVQAVLEQRKSMTRRTRGLKCVNESPNDWVFDSFDGRFYIFQNLINTQKHLAAKCPYGQVGDILWVRETWCRGYDRAAYRPENYYYKADKGNEFHSLTNKPVKWKPSLFMPKEACRIFLKITNIRVERLQCISEKDAVLEGVRIIHFAESKLAVFKNYLLKEEKGTLNPIRSFFSLWESINGKESLDSNPWVWVIEFERIDKPENFLS
jgi:hypothetical protein